MITLTKDMLKKILFIAIKGTIPDTMDIKTKAGIIHLKHGQELEVSLKVLENFCDDKGNVAPIVDSFIKAWKVKINMPTGKKSYLEKLKIVVESSPSLSDKDKTKYIVDIESLDALVYSLNKALGTNMKIQNFAKPKKETNDK